MPTQLELRFHAAMLDVYDRAVAELAGYRPTYFRQMVGAEGGVGAARKLLGGSASTGFAELFSHQRLDLSVEALVLQPAWRPLFTDAELREAEKRLREVGYRLPAVDAPATEHPPERTATPKPILSGLTREHVLRALDDLDEGVEHGFGEPTGYLLVYGDGHYAPKAVVGLAAEHAFGRTFGPTDFSGGNEPGQANHLLRALGFEVVEKPAEAGARARVTFDPLAVGEVYDRKELARLWGYRAWNAIGRGVVTPAGDDKILLFITREKQRALHPYQDHFEGDTLHIEGETNHAADQRIVGAAAAGDQVHLFYRARHHLGFTYYGEVHLLSAEIKADAPSRFAFATRRGEAAAASAMRTEQLGHADWAAAFEPENEGRRRVVDAVVYDRSVKNRARALELHGNLCAACGFDFNAFYGAHLARDFIEVHHTRSVTEIGDAPVDPATDLVPLCSNCHSMVHRIRGRILTLDELKAAIGNQRRGGVGEGA